MKLEELESRLIELRKQGANNNTIIAIKLDCYVTTPDNIIYNKDKNILLIEEQDLTQYEEL